MKKLLLLKCGEIILKGSNRHTFESMLVRNIKHSLHSVLKFKIQRSQAAIYIEPLDENADLTLALERLQKVFGIVSISPCYAVEKDMDVITKSVPELFKDEFLSTGTFKIEAKRADKNFPLISPEICADTGFSVLSAYENQRVDVHNPETTVTVDVRENYAYLYGKKIKGAGGLPSGSCGKGMLLLSGGIDSPVAGYLMARRGLALLAVNFFSYPYTSERAKQKVIDLAKIVGGYCGMIKLHVVPFTDIQLAIREKCREDYLTIIMRRFMTKISEKLAEKNEAGALITGESLGQVASQTLLSLDVTSRMAEIPILRPLIGFDKEDIIKISRKIGAFETSILPYEDCCTIFVPKHPVTKPKLQKVIEEESKLDFDGLVERALMNTEILEVYP